MEQKPSIGRIVHYHSYGTPGGEFLPAPRAAVIAEVHEGNGQPEGIYQEVSLVVLNPQGLFFNRAKFSAEPKPGHWSWPPRV